MYTYLVIGDNIETKLFDEYGHEVASCVQTAEADWVEQE